MNKITSNILIGIIVGFIANLIGTILYTLIFIDQDLNDVLYKVNEFNLLGKMIALGAALNFLPFFILLNRNKVYMARGVLIAMIVAALTTLVYKLDIWFS